MSEGGYAHLDEDLDIDLEKEILYIACEDNKPEFLSFMKNLYQKEIPKTKKFGKEESDGNQVKYCPPVILESICRYGAIDCAIAFFEGETGFITDLNVPFKNGLYPLHFAANSLLYEMVGLLLCHGARTDVRTIEGLARGDLSPLNVSLETVSYHRYLIDWTPKQSIFKLIIVLCLPQMKVPLEVNRLLALSTKEVDKIFSHYVTEGKLIEMATLLMVAPEKIMPLSMFESKYSSILDGSMSIRESIIEEIVSLSYDESKLIGTHKNGKLVRSLKDIKAALTRGLLLLKVFEKAGAAIEKYRQSVQSEMPKEKVVNDIKALLERAGFVLKDEDVDLSDIDCESERIKVATKALERRATCRSHSKDLCMPPNSLSCSYSKEKSSVRYGMGQWWSIRTFLQYGVLVFHPASSQSYITLPLINKNRDYYFPSNSASSITCGPPAMRVSAPFLLSRNRFASFALAIRKGITRI